MSPYIDATFGAEHHLIVLRLTALEVPVLAKKVMAITFNLTQLFSNQIVNA